MPVERDSSFQRAVDSVLFIRMSRVAIVSATLVGLPVAGYGIKRLINSADAIATTTESTARRVDLLEQSVRLTLDQRQREMDRIQNAQSDHEGRLRRLEFGEVPAPVRRP